MDRSGQFAMVAALEAWADAGYALPGADGDTVDPERLAVAMASGIGGVTTLLNNYDRSRRRARAGSLRWRSRC